MIEEKTTLAANIERFISVKDPEERLAIAYKIFIETSDLLERMLANNVDYMRILELHNSVTEFMEKVLGASSEEIVELMKDRGKKVPLSEKWVRSLEFKFKGQLLIYAVKTRNTELVKKILAEENIDYYAKDSNGQTPLILASYIGDQGMVEEFLERGADVWVRDGIGNTPFIIAAYAGHLRVIESLLAYDFTDEFGLTTDIFGSTALMYAAMAGHTKVVAKLLEKKPKDVVNIKNKIGMTALMYAAKYNHKAVVEELLKQGAIELGVQDNNGRDALIHAVMNGNKEIVTMLIKEGVSLEVQDNEGMSPFMHAIAAGELEIADMLLGAGANANVRNKQGQTPFKLAIEIERYDIALALLKRGTNLTLFDAAKSLKGLAPSKEGVGLAGKIVRKMLSSAVRKGKSYHETGIEAPLKRLSFYSRFVAAKKNEEALGEKSEHRTAEEGGSLQM